MSPSSRPLALALLVSVLVASGCGGSSSSSNSTTALTRSELIARADAICRRINARLAATTIRTPQDYARLLVPLGAYEREAVAEMRKFGPPPSMAKAWEQMVSGVETFAAATAKLGEEAKAKDLQATRSASQAATKGSQQLISAAQREGFRDCAKLR